MVRITVKPESGLIDEPVVIEVSGLGSEEDITFLATSTQSNTKLQAHAWYRTSCGGVVNTNTDPSLGGDYVGLEPMGLFWGMKRPEGNYANSLRPDFTTSYSVLIEVYRGNHDENALKIENALSSALVERLHVSSSVSRIPISHDIIKGVLFVPNGPGVYPGIVDIRGGTGLIENRPALLAAKGFVTLALNYFGYDYSKEYLDIEYFEEAVNFLSSHEKVRNIGVVGYSLGGVIALAMMGCVPAVKSVVLICGAVYPMGLKLKYKEKIWSSEKRDVTKYVTSNNTLYRANVFPKIESRDLNKYVPLFQNSEASLLSIQSEDDGMGYNAKIQNHLEEIFQTCGKTNYKFLKYEGAGHLLNVPYVPLSAKAYFNDQEDIPSFFGGKPLEHARAQKHAWKEMISFLKENLDNNVNANL